jgi:hypothetical protein
MSLTVKELARSFALAPDKILDDYTVRIATRDGKVFETTQPYVDPLTNSLIFNIGAEINLAQHETGKPADEAARMRARKKRKETLNV